MKKSIYHAGCLIVAAVFFQFQLIGQTTEKNDPKTVSSELYSEDDLAPYPFKKEEPQKKTFGQKIKESLAGEDPKPAPPAESQPEEYIRFYEFEDVTFSKDESDAGLENNQAGPMEDYKTTDDVYIYKREYYKDVTFADHDEWEDEPGLPKNEEAKPYQENDTSPAKSSKTTTLPPVEIKDEAYYRQDYINYYYHRKKKGNGTPENPPSFSEEIRQSKKRIWDRIEEKRAERKN